MTTNITNLLIMTHFNRVIITGSLTRDPDYRHLPNGTAVTDLNLVINERRKGPDGQWTEETTFIDVTVWGRLAEIVAEYSRKGTLVLVEGRLKLDTWTTDGQKRSKIKVIGENVQVLDKQ